MSPRLDSTPYRILRLLMFQSIPEYWWPYLYQYGVGAVIFVTGLFLILKNKSCDLSRRQDRFWLAVLLAGFVWYSGIHLVWYLAAIYILPAAPPGGTG